MLPKTLHDHKIYQKCNFKHSSNSSWGIRKLHITFRVISATKDAKLNISVRWCRYFKKVKYKSQISLKRPFSKTNNYLLLKIKVAVCMRL